MRFYQASFVLDSVSASTPTFALIIPTHNAGELWRSVLESITQQASQPQQLLIIDSESSDQTLEIAHSFGFATHSIPQQSFNHALTRQYAIEQLSAEIEYVVFMTQDVILQTPQALTELLAAFDNDSIGFAFGRQIAHIGASAIEQHARQFNYPEHSYQRSWQQRDQYGIKTVFCSNAFSAIRLSAFHQVQGFDQSLPGSEDTYICAKLLKNGWQLAYQADAIAHHSHSYSCLQEMQRYIKIGQFHGQQDWILKELGRAEGEGLKFVKSEIKYLWQHQKLAIPHAALRTLLKWIGFRYGAWQESRSKK